ncbi:DUF1501 domain-containing protein [Duganella sp. BuS-21]|uniref:DUF1501 domain-containing protein n=1 Tax=Duganella sp. BuS-21 TaxID=2943848 RepID=UPI0035A652E0
MSKPMQSRRNFLGSMLSLAGGTAIPFSMNLAAMSSAAAATASDYKALVCVFLTGGNDGFNTVLSTDPESWASYSKYRTTASADSIALGQGSAYSSLLPIAPTTAQAGRSFALHPSMTAMRDLFNNGNLAVVANVGTLIQPTTKAEFHARSVPLPSKLFSHNDQQAVWQSNQPEGSNTSGWGARMVEMLAAANANSSFAAVSTSGNSTFLSGRMLRQLQFAGTSIPAIKNLSGPLFGSTLAANTLRDIITADSTDLIQKEHAAVARNAITTQAAASTAMLPIGAGGVVDPSWYVNPNTGVASVNPLAVQLQTVARMIGGRNTLGMKRQVFYVSIGGFDTHDKQRTHQADLLAQLSHAMRYFNAVLYSLPGGDMTKQVTLFTASDFGRTFTSNGDGTDHGWGSHHFVMGGAVKGKDIYGTMPAVGIGHKNDAGSGALLPAISVDQYGATLGSWFGLSATETADVFPNIGNFSTRNLGFMNAV